MAVHGFQAMRLGHLLGDTVICTTINVLHFLVILDA